MQVHLKDIRNCLDKAQEIAEQYRMNVLAAHGPEKSIEELLRICRVYLEKNVEVNELEIPVEHKSVLGHYLKFPDRYVINIQPGLDEGWHRFVLCKELFHVILDEPDCCTIDIYGHLEGVAVSFPVEDSQPSRAVASELLAEIAAMEFLFPYARRVEGLAAYDGNNVDYAAIAKKYNIPQLFTEIYLADRHMENLGILMPK